jgi:pilus assembly protein Flp/PilA
MIGFIQRLLRDETGATAVEYGLIAALMSVIVLVAVQLLREPLAGVFGKVGGQLDQAQE